MFVSGAYGGFSSSGASELVSDVKPVSEVAVEEDSEVTVELELPVEAASEVESTVEATSELHELIYVEAPSELLLKSNLR